MHFYTMKMLAGCFFGLGAAFIYILFVLSSLGSVETGDFTALAVLAIMSFVFSFGMLYEFFRVYYGTISLEGLYSLPGLSGNFVYETLYSFQEKGGERFAIIRIVGEKEKFFLPVKYFPPKVFLITNNPRNPYIPFLRKVLDGTKRTKPMEKPRSETFKNRLYV